MNKGYIFIAGPSLSRVSISYRRVHLLKYIINKSSGEKIIWVYFENSSIFRCGKWSERNIDIDGHNVVSIRVSDWKYLLSYSQYLQIFFLRKLIKRLVTVDGARLVYTLPRFATLASRRKKVPLSYDCTDNWVGSDVSKSLRYFTDRLIMKSELTIARNANVVFASSPFLFRKMSEINANTLSVEHGITPSNSVTQSMKSYSSEISKNFCYVGSVSRNKIDLELLFRLFRSKCEWDLLIIGEIHGDVLRTSICKRLLNLDNVKWTGFVRPDVIASLLVDRYIGLLPYHKNEFTKGIFPLKLKEYISMGLRVVSVNLELPDRFSDVVLSLNEDGATILASIENFIDNSKHCDFDLVAFRNGASWDSQFDLMKI
jgi:glycosyltransferase involved in cell wall biosynthesis